MWDDKRIWAIRIPSSTGKRYLFAQVSFVISCTSPYLTSAHRKTFSGISGGSLANLISVFLMPTASMVTVDISPLECLYCIWPSVSASIACMRLLSWNFMYTCRFVMSICNMRMSCGNIRKFSWIHSCISYAEMRGLFISKAHRSCFGDRLSDWGSCLLRYTASGLSGWLDVNSTALHWKQALSLSSSEQVLFVAPLEGEWVHWRLTTFCVVEFGTVFSDEFLADYTVW
jgi:hypothetical protein